MATKDISTQYKTMVMPEHLKAALVRRQAIEHHTPRLGATLGGYKVCLKLASGGMATVHLGRAEGPGGIPRFAALKCLKPDLARDAQFVEMFFDEAQIAYRINHPNVCRALDFGEADGVSYLVLEYVAGETLASLRHQLVDRIGKLPPAHHAGVVARIIADACEGLHAAHELRSPDGQPLGVVHRDVSPENIFLTYDGNVKIFDFGVALASHQRHRTRTGVLKGKYSYIQPEVLAGLKPDRRADVWGLGVVLWELLTAKHLFDFPTEVETLRAVSDMHIPAPSSVSVGLPVELDAIVAKALERNPDKRYPTARELGRNLVKFLTEQRLAIGLAEVEEYMDRLFPNGRESQRQLLKVVEQFDDATGAVDVDMRDEPRDEAEAAPDEKPRRIASVASMAVPTPRPVAPPPVAPPPVAPPPIPDRVATRAWHSPSRFAVASLAFLCLASGAWFVTRTLAHSVGPTEAAAAKPTPAQAPPAVTGDSAMWLEVSAAPSDQPDSVLLRVRLVPKDGASTAVSSEEETLP